MKKNVVFVIIIAIFACGLIYLTLFNRQNKSTMVFGSLLPLSGQISAYGEMMQRGQLLAVEEIKSKYKDDIKIEFFNTEHKKDVALSRIIEAKNKGIRYFTEIFGSDQAEHCLDFVKSNNLFVLSGVDTKPDLVEKSNGNFVRIMPNDAEATKEIFLWLKEKNYKNVAILYVNDDWGTGLLNSALLNIRNFSINLVGQFDINKNQQSFSSTVARLKGSKPDAICLFIYPDDGGRFIKEAFRQKLKVEYFATENFTGNDMIKTAQKAAVGVKLIIPSTPPNNLSYKKMLEEYKLKYNEEPSIFAIKGYDAVLVLYDIIKKSKSNNIEDIKEVVRNNYTYQGASGKISFNSNDEFVSAKYVRLEYSVKNDKIQLIPVQN